MEQATTDTEPLVREILPEELAKTADLRREMTMEVDGTDYDLAHPGWRDRYTAFFQDFLRTNRGQFFVAEAAGKLIGTAAVYKLVNHRSAIVQKQSAYVSTVYVNPQWRRRGIGRALTLQTVEWAKRNGCEVIRLRSSAQGRSLYERVGFKQSDELELRF
jgi:GNAT superfamily N-acetyltransferase